MTTTRDRDSERAAEQWLRNNGFPTSVSPAVRRRRLAVRTAPVFVGLSALAVEVALLVTGWTFFDSWRNGNALRHAVYLLMFPIGVLAPILLMWLVGRVLAALPRGTRPAAAAALSGGAVIGAGCLIHGEITHTAATTAAVTVIGALVTGAVAVAVAYWGAGTIPRWAAGQALRQLASVWAFVGKMIPMLVLTILFFLCAPEAWQLAASMSRVRLWESVLVLAGAGGVFMVVSAIDNVGKARRTAHAPGERFIPLKTLEKVNAVGLVVIVQFIQAFLLAVMTFLFFTILACVLVPHEVMITWVCNDAHGAAACTTDPQLAVGGASRATGTGPWLAQGSLFRLPIPFLPQVLIQVCILIAAIAAVAFVGSSVVESQHHQDFYEPILRHVDKVMEHRDRYLGDTARGDPGSSSA